MALVIIGGIKRISSVAQVIVPFMAITYVILAVLIIGFNITKVPGAFATIVKSAFGVRAAAGGALGAMMVAMQNGIARGIFLTRQDSEVLRLQQQRHIPMNRPSRDLSPCSELLSIQLLSVQ